MDTMAYLWSTPVSNNVLGKISIAGATAILFLTLLTNQVFHNGVWGKLHNKSVKPKIEISSVNLNQDKLSFTVYRVEGADVYGSFLIGITLKDANGNIILDRNGEDLSKFPAEDIQNKYVAKVVSSKYSLVIPLGSKAELTIKDKELTSLPKGNYELILTDISGITWKQDLTY